MSPEQAAGTETLDARSDVYAVGCLLYEMLTGQPPFTDATANSVIRQHLIAEPRPVTDVRAAVPEPVAMTLARALAKHPVDGFESARAFSEALGSSSQSATVRSPSRSWFVRHGALAAAVILTTLAGSLVLTTMRLRRTGVETPRVAVLPLRMLSADELELLLRAGLARELDLPYRLDPRPRGDVTQLGTALPRGADTDAEDREGAGSRFRARRKRQERFTNGST